MLLMLTNSLDGSSDLLVRVCADEEGLRLPRGTAVDPVHAHLRRSLPRAFTPFRENDRLAQAKQRRAVAWRA